MTPMMILYLAYLATFPGFVLRGPPANAQPKGAVSFAQFSAEHTRQAPGHRP